MSGYFIRSLRLDGAMRARRFQPSLVSLAVTRVTCDKNKKGGGRTCFEKSARSFSVIEAAPSSFAKLSELCKESEALPTCSSHRVVDEGGQ